MSILSQAEIVAYCRSVASVTDEDVSLLTLLQGPVEDRIRRHVGYHIEARTGITEYWPGTRDWMGHGDRPALLDVRGSNVLRLSQLPVRAITTIHEDADAFFGQATSAFGTGDLLTSGTEYVLQQDYDENGDGTMEASLSGLVIRRQRGWTSAPGSVKIVYNGGFQAANVPGDIKLAVLHTIADRFVMAKSFKKDGPGRALDSERLGDFAQSWATDAGSNMGLAKTTIDLLEFWVRK